MIGTIGRFTDGDLHLRSPPHRRRPVRWFFHGWRQEILADEP
ncbi:MULTISPECIES: hypothetical protein [Protofrankia]|nr:MULTISPECIES: hypothetical protein [Protofrankia]